MKRTVPPNNPLEHFLLLCSVRVRVRSKVSRVKVSRVKVSRVSIRVRVRVMVYGLFFMEMSDTRSLSQTILVTGRAVGWLFVCLYIQTITLAILQIKVPTPRFILHRIIMDYSTWNSIKLS